MTLIQKLLNKFQRKEKTVVTTRSLAKHMKDTRTILVPNYRENNVKEPNISMFH